MKLKIFIIQIIIMPFFQPFLMVIKLKIIERSENKRSLIYFYDYKFNIIKNLKNICFCWLYNEKE